MNRPLTYLAVPYSHPDPAVRLSRFKCANIAAGALMREGELVFSPISHTHPIATACNLPLGFDYWERYDRAVLSCCSKLYVLTMAEWQWSKGVRAETKMARDMGIEVRFIYLCEMPDGSEKLVHTSGRATDEKEWLRLLGNKEEEEIIAECREWEYKDYMKLKDAGKSEELKQYNVVQSGIYVAGTWIKDDPNDESNKE